MRDRLRLAGVLLFTFALFVPTIRYALVYDDIQQIIFNQRLSAWSYLPGYFTTDLWAHTPRLAHCYYRPIFLVWLRLSYAALGPPHAIWHLFSIVAHLATTACVFVFVRRLLSDSKGAVLAALLFAIHPVQTETVAWISASGDLLLTAFLVLTVYFYAKRERPISAVSIALATLAMFTKEPGIVAPLLIFAYEWINSRFKDAIVGTTPYMVPAILYVACRMNALGGNLTLVADPNMSIRGMFLTWPRVLGIYARHLVWPVHLSAFYDVPVQTALWPMLLLIVVIGGLLWLLSGTSNNVKFGAAWFMITLAPVLVFRYATFHDFVHDRYLYLPSVGLVLMASVLFARIRFDALRVAAACALVLIMSCGTHSNMLIWENGVSLFTRAMEFSPDNPSVETNLAYELLKAHREQEAFPLLTDLLQRYPDSPTVNYNMAHYYQQTGNNEEAEHYFSIADRLWGQVIR